MKIHKELQQRSPEWLDLKLAKVGGSTAERTKGSKKETFMCELLAEHFTQTQKDFYVNDAMQWGIDQEDAACEAFEEITGKKVEHVGYIEIDSYIGFSPDGLIKKGDIFTEFIEIKCLNTANHIAIMRADKIPTKHLTQCLLPFVYSDLKKMHIEKGSFVSFDPRLPQYMQAHIIELKREDYTKQIEALRIQLEVFTNELSEYIQSKEFPF
jgi:hypothetical protein